MNSSDRLEEPEGYARGRSRGLTGKLILALLLVAVVPLLVAAYSLHVSSRGGVDPTATLPATSSLLAPAPLSTLAGGVMLWKLLTAAPRAAGVLESPSARPLAPDRAVESGTTTPAADKGENVEALMHAFTRA